MSKFDPDKPYVRIRGIGSVRYIQDGKVYSSGYKYLSKADGTQTPAEIKKEKDDVRSRARAKIASKRKKKPEEDPLEGFRESETPDAISTAKKENAAARQAEENAG